MSQNAQEYQKDSPNRGTIVFVHGFMSTSEPWRKWCDYFEALGYRCFAPSWPYHDRTVEELRNAPDPRLGKTSLRDVIDHYIAFIKQLDCLPVLVGHSLGGVIVQMLLQEGYGEQAICINSGPPKGIVVTNWDFIWSNIQLLNPFSSRPLCLMSPHWYHRYVCNEMQTLEEAESFVREHCVPASRRVAATIGQYGVIDFARPHRPLLFIAGDQDRSQPPAVNLRNRDAYTDRGSICDYKLFEGRTHNVINQNNWTEVAQYIAQWLDR